MLDISPVATRLYQGGAVDPARSYRPFSMVVLCAEEHQPALPRFPGVILRPAFDDTQTPTARDIQQAQSAARKVVREWQRNPSGNILVTCYMGWNRSGLVMGLALNELTPWTPEQILAIIQRARGPNALSNPTFQQLIVAGSRYHQRRVPA